MRYPLEAVHTTTGEPFTDADHALLAALVFIRFGRETATAAAAWRRLFGTACPDPEYAQLAGYGLPHAEHYRLDLARHLSAPIPF